MSQIQKGTTYATGSTVSATNLNAHVDSAVLLPGAIGDQTLAAATTSDHLLVRDASSGLLKKSTAGSIVNSVLNTATSVGVGTASPYSKLDVVTSSNVYPIRFTGPDGLIGYLLSDSVNIGLVTDGASSGMLISPTGDRVGFNTAGAERLRITNSGNIGIGTGAPAYALQLGSDSAAKPTSSLWTIASDSRIKRNINALDGAASLAKIEKIRPVSFGFIPEYLAETKSEDKTYYNFIAQELEQVFPECVRRVGHNLERTVSPEVRDASGAITTPAVKEVVVRDVASVDSHNLIIHLISAVQVLSAKIKALEAK